MLEKTKYYQEIKKEKKDFDFVGYRALIIGTLYTSRLYDSFHKFKTEGVVNVFVSNMKKQIAHLPHSSKLRQTLSMPNTEKEIYGIQPEEAMCLKTLKLLANNGLIKFSKKEKTFSTFSKNKLTKQQNHIILTVDRMYALKDNRLREMIFDCSEEILVKDNHALAERSHTEGLLKQDTHSSLSELNEIQECLKILKLPEDSCINYKLEEKFNTEEQD